MFDLIIACLIVGLVMFITEVICQIMINNILNDLKNKKNSNYYKRLNDINDGLIMAMLSGCVYVVMIILLIVGYILGGKL